MDYNLVITRVNDFENEILDQKEDVLDPIRKFWNGEQKKIFDGINTYLNGDQSNFEYVDDTELTILKEVRNNPKPFAGNLMKDAKEAMEALQKKILETIDTEKKESSILIQTKLDKIKEREDFKSLELTNQTQVLEELNTLLIKTNNQRYIAQLRQYREEANNHFNNALNSIQKLLIPKDDKVNEPRVQYIKQSNIKVSYGKSELKTAEEVEEYVEELRKELLRQINENRRITL
jgi:hypothetical protein